MLGIKEELQRCVCGEMCVYLQPAAKLSCSTLPNVPLYIKLGMMELCAKILQIMRGIFEDYAQRFCQLCAPFSRLHVVHIFVLKN